MSVCIGETVCMDKSESVSGTECGPARVCVCVRLPVCVCLTRSVCVCGCTPVSPSPCPALLAPMCGSKARSAAMSTDTQGQGHRVRVVPGSRGAGPCASSRRTRVSELWHLLSSVGLCGLDLPCSVAVQLAPPACGPGAGFPLAVLFVLCSATSGLPLPPVCCGAGYPCWPSSGGLSHGGLWPTLRSRRQLPERAKPLVDAPFLLSGHLLLWPASPA